MRTIRWPNDHGAEQPGQAADAGADDGPGDADADGPQELGPVGEPKWGMRDDVKREGPVPGPAVESDEDERPDARGQQARHQDHAQERAAEAGRLHEQERPEIGDPSSVLIAAKLPAAPMTTTAWPGASLR